MAGNYSTPDTGLPSPLGYQNVGEVTDVGPDVTGIEVGTVLFSGVWLVSNHVEYVVVPQNELLVRLPDSVDRRHAALLGMAGVAVHVCRSIDVRAGENVLIVGQGCVGQMTAQMAYSLGAAVDVCDVHPARLRTAGDVGCARSVFDTSGSGWAEHVGDVAYDTVVDLAGVPGMENRLIAAARPHGQVAFIAGRDEVRYDFNLGQSRQITLRQISHFDLNDPDPGLPCAGTRHDPRRAPAAGRRSRSRSRPNLRHPARRPGPAHGNGLRVVMRAACRRDPKTASRQRTVTGGWPRAAGPATAGPATALAPVDAEARAAGG